MNEKVILDSESYPVTWYINAVRIQNKIGRKKGIFDVAICGYSNKIAFLNLEKNILKPLIIRDIYIQKQLKICEDSKWCLCKSCPLNKIDLRRVGYGIKKQKELDNLLDHIDYLQEKFGNIFKIDKLGVLFRYSEPDIILTIEKKPEEIKL